MYQFSKEELRDLHSESSYHRKRLKTDQGGGCFYCKNYFETEEIVEWIDNDETALCPRCGIDSVLPGMIQGVHDDLLEAMNEYWFQTRISTGG